MEKIYSLLWILFAIGVFVFRMVKKMQETTAREERERPGNTVTPAPALPEVSFQELLKQMQQRNSSGDQPPTPAPVKKSKKKPAERTPGGRAIPHETARPAKSQERTNQKAKSLEAGAPVAVYAAALPRASTEAPITDYWEDRERRRVKEHAQEATVTPLNLSVRQLLTQPESVRAAFVLSEILQRRHF